MEIRNAQYNNVGTVNCEIEHPVHGWIPFTASPDDVELFGREVFELVKEIAEPYVEPEPDPEAERMKEQEAARAYLASTDWMVVRAVETGTALDEEVRKRRAAARKTASNQQEYEV